MSRIVEPPAATWPALRTSLTQGERRVAELFDLKLSPEWEIYIQPHLNGLRPDIVLLHPRVGVAVFEIKDWDLGAMEYFAAPQSGELHLMARDRTGKVFSREHDNPISKVLQYKEELFELYCPRLNDRAGNAVITAGVIFTRSSSEQLNRVFAPFKDLHAGYKAFPRYYPVACAEDVDAGNLDSIFPEHSRSHSTYMNAELADDLRGWLREPDHAQSQRRPIELNERQRFLVESRTETGYRRIKGPAGAGKSLVLAARAARLASEGKQVMMVSFNITLLNYLRDLAVRQVHRGSSVIKDNVVFLNFHLWCKRVCAEAGRLGMYKKLWKTMFDEDSADHQPILDQKLPTLVGSVIDSCDSADVPTRYDAIIVDEGQDFRLSWWKCLRMVLKPGGEMLLAADKTQDVYGTASAWTDEAMTGSGFAGGRWAELNTSYRLPEQIKPLLARFAQDFMAGHEVDLPLAAAAQLEFADLFPVDLRFVQVDSASPGAIEVCVAEIIEMMKRLKDNSGVSDIVFLSNKTIGSWVVNILRERHDIRVLNTFASDGENARRMKRAFFQGSAQIKATTLHSFKGWEARHLIVFVNSVTRPDDCAVLYTAMTRLLQHERGSSLTVISGCDELRSFGKSWPEYVVL